MNGSTILSKEEKREMLTDANSTIRKEAFFKAIGTGYRNGLAFNHIEIANDDLGKPIIQLSGKTKEFIEQMNIKNIHLSISHTNEYATATVIIEN